MTGNVVTITVMIADVVAKYVASGEVVAGYCSDWRRSGKIL